MAESKTIHPSDPPARDGDRGHRPPLTKCPHCGRLVATEVEKPVAPSAELPAADRCPACGLPIPKERLA